MVVLPDLAALDEQDVIAEVVHDLLTPLRIPPFRRKVALTAGHNDPETGPCVTGDLIHLRHPLLLLKTEMDVSSERMRLNLQSETVVEEHPIGMDEVIGKIVAVMDEGIFTRGVR